MKDMPKVFLPLLCATAILAQTASGEAPPRLDAALRQRVTQFYRLQVEGKYRAAQQLVANDTQDLFIQSSKPIYMNFKILHIQYTDHFRRALVTLLVTRNVPVEGFLGHPIETRIPSRWKLERGEWFWYVDPQKDEPRSPFGIGGPPGMAMSGGAMPAGPAPRALPKMPSIPPTANAVRVDKMRVELKASGPSSDKVGIVNSTPWNVHVTVDSPRMLGLTVKLDRATIPPGEKAFLTIQSRGAIPHVTRPFAILVRIDRPSETIPISVSLTK